MSDEQVQTEPTAPGGQVVHDGMEVGSNEETQEQMRDNFATEEKPKDGDAEEEARERRSEAAKELGKAGGKASAEKRAAEDAEGGDEEGLETAPNRSEEQAEEEPAEAQEKAPEAEEEPEEKAEPKPRNDARARVMEATKKLSEERQKREELEARLARLEQERAAPPQKPEPQVDVKPQRELYNSEEEWVEALTDWKTERKVQELQAKTQREQAEQRRIEAMVSRIDAFNDRIAKVANADPEVLDRMDPDLLSLTPTFLLHPDQAPTPQSDLAQGILESEHAAELLLHLSENQGDLDTLLRQPDSYAVVRALGALEARILAAPKPAPEPKPKPAPVSEPSSAAPPMKPVEGSSQYSETIPDGDMDFDEFVRVSNARDRRARSGR